MKTKNLTIISLACLMLAGAFFFTTSRNAESVPMTAPAEIVANVSVAQVVNGPNFGRIVPPAALAQDFTIQPDGVLALGAGTGRFLDGQAAAQVTVNGPINTTVDVTATANAAAIACTAAAGALGAVNLNAINMALAGVAGAGTANIVGLALGGTGTQTVNVGGTVNVSFDASGTFNCNYDINAVIQ